MTKHVSSGGDAASSPRDAATENLPTSDAAAAQRLSHDATGARGSDGIKDVTDLKDTADTADAGSVRTEALAKDVTQDSAKGPGAARSAAAGNSTADTRLGGAWASPDAQNAATIGVMPSASAATKKVRTKAHGPWYRRRAVVGAAGVALLAGSFGAGWGTNELLSSHSQHGQAQQQGGGHGRGMPGGGQGGLGGPGGPGGQGGKGRPGGQNGQNGQGGPGGGSGGAGRTTPNGDASSGSGSGSSGDQQSGSGSGDGNQKGGSGSSGVLQQQDANPSTQG